MKIEEANNIFFSRKRNNNKKRLTTAMNHNTTFNWICDNDVIICILDVLIFLSKNSQVRAIEMKTPIST